MLAHIISLYGIFLSVSLITLSCSEDKKRTIIGEWELAIRPYNIGTRIIFKEDSSYIQIKEARVNYTYELDDNTLISTSFNGFTGQTIIDSAHITINGDSLILIRGKIGNQQKTIMKRYDSVYTKPQGIIGFWKWAHQSGKYALSEFHRDGHASVSVLIEHREGYYFVNADSVTIVMPGTTLRDIHYRLKEDTLFFLDKYAPLGKVFHKISKENK